MLVSPATPAQARFIVSLVTEVYALDAEGAEAKATQLLEKPVTRADVSRLIDGLISARDYTRQADRAARVSGARAEVIARHELAHGDVLKGAYGIGRVVKAQAGHLYAMLLEGVGAEADYVYWPRGLETMGADATARKLTFDEACEISAARGKCIICNRRLKAGASVKAGIGPVCRKRVDM
jgi:Family of unknown function (DUF6011)